MTFGAVCSPALVQYIKNVHAEKYIKQFSRAVEAIVGTIMTVLPLHMKPITTLEQVMKIHRLAEFNLRGSMSNHNTVLHSVSEPHQDSKMVIDSFNEKVKVLEMWWKIGEDHIRYKINESRIGNEHMNGEVKPTKRQVLRI